MLWDDLLHLESGIALTEVRYSVAVGAPGAVGAVVWIDVSASSLSVSWEIREAVFGYACISRSCKGCREGAGLGGL